MNYFDVLLDEFCYRNQTTGDSLLINLFNSHYDEVSNHFESCIDTVIKNCDEECGLSKKYLIAELSYEFINAFKNEEIIDSETDLIIWAILSYEPNNFLFSLKKVVFDILETTEYYCEHMKETN